MKRIVTFSVFVFVAVLVSQAQKVDPDKKTINGRGHPQWIRG